MAWIHERVDRSCANFLALTVLDPLTLRCQPFYCEENIHHLSQYLYFSARAPAALFVSGLGGECVMWHQKQARRPER